MFTLRKDQFDLLETHCLRQYENRLCLRLQEIYPEETRALEYSQLLSFVHEGVVRARGYGLETERDISLFIDLMVFLGWNFDHNPQLPWVREILDDEYILSPSLRIDTLHERAVTFLKSLEAQNLRELLS